METNPRYNKIKYNNIYNTTIGIRLTTGVLYNEVKCNKVVNSNCSIVIFALNYIHHNNIVNGSDYTGYDVGDAGIWDDGYPSGGNFWSDYSGTDIFTGSNQDIPGSDGIGDTPYTAILGITQDNYPLMQPYDCEPPISRMEPISPYWHNSSSLTINANASDNNAITNVTLWYRYSPDNSSWGNWTSYGTDSVSLWSWDFDFPNGGGFYEFGSIANDTSGNPSSPNTMFCICEKIQIGHDTRMSYEIELQSGWNLISLPLIQDNESLESVLSSIDGKWDKIMTYDPLNPQPWSSTATYKPDNLNEIDLLDHKMGFWIHILPSETTTQAYTYQNVSQTTNDHYAWSLDVDEASDAEFKNPNSQTEFANFRYSQIVSSDDVRASSLNPGEDDEIFTMSSFNISENPAEINRINMTMEIQGNMASDFQVWVFNVMTDTWVPLGASEWAGADTDIVLGRAIETNCADYISGSGAFLWGCYQTNSSELVRVDYMGIEIHSSVIENTILTVSGTIPESTDIPLYAGWNLVSYPTLNDTMIVSLAFFGTGADRVEVCDPAEPYLIKEVGPTYVMQPGEGYWVHVPADTVWTVDW